MDAAPSPPLAAPVAKGAASAAPPVYRAEYEEHLNIPPNAHVRSCKSSLLAGFRKRGDKIFYTFFH